MKRAIRKPTRDEMPFMKVVAAQGADVYRDDWPRAQQLANEGLIALSPPRGMGNAWKRAVLPGREDW